MSRQISQMDSFCLGDSIWPSVGAQKGLVAQRKDLAVQRKVGVDVSAEVFELGKSAASVLHRT